MGSSNGDQQLNEIETSETFENFDFDKFFEQVSGSGGSHSYEPKYLNVGHVLFHLSKLIGEDICQYKSRFLSPQMKSATPVEDGYICCSVADDSDYLNSKIIMVANAPSQIIEERWATAFTPLKPVRLTWSDGSECYSAPKLHANGAVEDPIQSIQNKKSAAKREASLKREREDGGKFKRCKTQWIAVTDFYKTNQTSSNVVENKIDCA